MHYLQIQINVNLIYEIHVVLIINEERVDLWEMINQSYQ